MNPGEEQEDDLQRETQQYKDLGCPLIPKVQWSSGHGVHLLLAGNLTPNQTVHRQTKRSVHARKLTIISKYGKLSM